jgi:hypothetical protein
MNRPINGVNQLLNFFFTFYLWTFYTPFIEINSGIMVVGLNAFLTIYRETTDFSVKPLWEIILPIEGLVLTLITGVIVIYCFRSYQFEETLLLKRKFHFS